jgi:hypothetical protein
MQSCRCTGFSLTDPAVAEVGKPTANQSNFAQIDPVHGM